MNPWSRSSESGASELNGWIPLAGLGIRNPGSVNATCNALVTNFFFVFFEADFCGFDFFMVDKIYTPMHRSKLKIFVK